MKTSRMIVATAISATLLALGACSNSEEPSVIDLAKPIDLRMESVVVTTRSLISEGATTFENGDRIGVYLGAYAADDKPTGLTSGKYQNMQYTLGSEGWAGEPIYWQSATMNHTLYAYYPFTGTAGTAVTADQVDVSIAQDQNANGGRGYKAADYMWVQTVAVPTNNAVPLVLQHKMSLIKVTMTAGDGFGSLTDVAALTPAIKGTIFKAGSWNLADGAIAATTTGIDPSFSAITPNVVNKAADATAPSLTYYAIVMPGTTFAHDSEFVSLADADGTTYVYKLALNGGGDLTTAQGTYYSFDLTAKKTGLTLSTFTIGAWAAGTETEGDAGMVVR